MFMSQELFNRWAPGLELEASIKGPANMIFFNKTLAHVIYVNAESNDGMKPTLHEEVLDISFPSDIRVSIRGKEHISAYCKSGDLTNIPKSAIECIKKFKILTQNFDDHNVRMRLSSEENTSLPDMDDVSKKTFRLKKRISITTIDKLCRYDFTIVKQINDETSISKLNSNTKEHREIELEYIGTDKKVDHGKFVEHLITMLKAYYSDPELTTLSTKIDVIHSYVKCVANAELFDKFVQKNWQTNTFTLVENMTRIYKNMPQTPRVQIKPYQFVIGAKPKTLEKVNLMKTKLPNIFAGYKATIKADGERTLVYVDPSGGVYLINSNMDVKFAGLQKSRKVHVDLHKNTLYDGELVNHLGNNFIYIFDCYIHDNINISSSDLSDRMKMCKDFQTNHFTFKVKEYFDVDKVKIHLDKNSDFDMDGIIYTPEGKAETSGTWINAFKWKPHEQNTIDFLVKFERDENNEITHVIRDGLPCTTLKLFVASSTPSEKGGKNTYGAMRFRTSDKQDHTMIIPKNGKCANNDVIVDGHVVEASFDVNTKTWVPYRVRYDKTWNAMINKTVTMNNITSALNIWNTIKNPVTIPNLINGINETDGGNKYFLPAIDRSLAGIKNMNKFHNMIKGNLYKSLSQKLNMKKPSLLDVACGKGGDILKWSAAGFTTVIGIDIIPDNITNPVDGANVRLSKTVIGKDTIYAFVPMDMTLKIGKTQINNIADNAMKKLARCLWELSNKSKCVIPRMYGLAKIPFNVVSCQFAIHYSFATKQTLDGFLKNVFNNLAPGGFFGGTCFDGSSVALKFAENNEKKIVRDDNGRVLWSIERHYSDDYDEERFGQEISVFIETINVEHREFLVPYKLLKSSLEEIGLIEIESRMFGSIRGKKTHDMNDAQIEFSNLNRMFIFQKPESD
jgi:SAM-dependent methyltransferase